MPFALYGTSSHLNVKSSKNDLLFRRWGRAEKRHHYYCLRGTSQHIFLDFEAVHVVSGSFPVPYFQGSCSKIMRIFAFLFLDLSAHLQELSLCTITVLESNLLS